MKLKLLLALFVFASAIGFAVVFPTTIHAQTATSSSNTTSDFSNLDKGVPNNLHTYTQSVFIEMFSGITCMLVGQDMVNPQQQCLGVNMQNGKIGYAPTNENNGLVGAMGNLIGMTFTKPIGVSNYFAYEVSKFGISKHVYAADNGESIGFQGLQPIQKLWIQFRNVTYLLFTLLFIFLGLGIMFRMPIGDRTVMTVQSAIPKIVVGLLLVTFSYAIGGFLIDLMWVVIFLVFSLFAPVLPHTGDMIQALHGTPFGFANSMGSALGISVGIFKIPLQVAQGTGGVLSSIINNSGAVMKSIFGIVASPFVIGCVVVKGSGSLLSLHPFSGFTQCVGQMYGLLAGIIIFLIAFIALMYTLIKLWFILLTSYVKIIISIVVAPFWIAIGIVPGSKMGFGTWLRYLVTYLAVFPATVFMFLIAGVFLSGFGSGSGTDFVPPLIGSPGDINLLSALLGFATILMTPQVLNMVRNTIGAPEQKYAAQIGAALGVGRQTAAQPVAKIRESLFNKEHGQEGAGTLVTRWAREKAHGAAAKTPGIRRLPFVNEGKVREWLKKQQESAHTNRIAKDTEAQNRYYNDPAHPERQQERQITKQDLKDFAKEIRGSNEPHDDSSDN